jgi:hypothetical protein
MFKLEEKLSFLNDTRKNLALQNKVNALPEVNSEITITESKIQELKNGPLAIHFKYVAEDNKFFMGSREIVDAFVSDFGLTEHAFAMAAIKYEDKTLLNLFEYAAKNFNKFARLEFLTESIDETVKVLTMRSENNIFVYRTNEATKMSTFKKMHADLVVDYVAEQTGVDVSFMVEDILEHFKNKTANRQGQIDMRYEMISFLKDQKGRLAEANKTIPAIKAADLLIDEEINKINTEIQGLEEEENLTRNDGFITAFLNTKIEEYATGTEIKVDALDYTSAGKEDILTVFIQDNPVRVEKFRIEMPSTETV